MKDNLIYFPDVWQDSMEDLYENFTLDELKEIAQIHDIPGLYKYKKKQKIALIISNILSKEYMWDFFLCASEEELDLFEQMMDDEEILEEDPEELRLMMSYFFRGGYMVWEDDKGITIPAEVKDAYDRMNTAEFRKAHQEYLTAYNYCCGLTALYGMVSLDEVTRLYNAYENKKIKPEEMLFDVFLPSLKKTKAIIYTDNMLVEYILVHEDGLMDDILKIRSSCDPYIPTRDEIYELSHEIEKPLMVFGNYLMEHMRFPIQTAMGVTELAARMLKIGADPEDVFNLLQQQDVTFISQEQADAFAEELVELWMHLRLYTMYGHTPSELEMEEL